MKRCVQCGCVLVAAFFAKGTAVRAADLIPGVTPEERAKIEQAIPAKAPAAPKQPRKLLVFDLNVGYPGHRSIPHANLAISLMGKRTGAFETVVSHDPEVFRPASLKHFDAVFLNNTVGNLFTDRELRRSLLDFVSSGGGLLGVHGTTVAFTRWPEGAKEDWPEFAQMLGARGQPPREHGARLHQARRSRASAQSRIRRKRLRLPRRVLSLSRGLLPRPASTCC